MLVIQDLKPPGLQCQLHVQNVKSCEESVAVNLKKEAVFFWIPKDDVKDLIQADSVHDSSIQCAH